MYRQLITQIQNVAKLAFAKEQIITEEFESSVDDNCELESIDGDFLLVNIKKTTDNPNTMLSKDEMLAEPATGIVRVVNGVHFIGNGTYSQADFDASLARLNRDWIFFTKDDSDDEDALASQEHNELLAKIMAKYGESLEAEDDKGAELESVLAISEVTSLDDLDDDLADFEEIYGVADTNYQTQQPTNNTIE